MICKLSPLLRTLVLKYFQLSFGQSFLYVYTLNSFVVVYVAKCFLCNRVACFYMKRFKKKNIKNRQDVQTLCPSCFYNQSLKLMGCIITSSF